MRIAAASIAAEVKPQGAELYRLRDGAGQEFLWDAGPAWPRHSPVLFPIVGKLAGDTLRHAGRDYRMTQHGFARDREFTPILAEPDRCVFRLTDDAATRAAYPFAFLLEIHYAVAKATLRVEYRLANPGGEPLPASLGAHPAFRWPLPGAEGQPHAILFDQPEPAPARRLSVGLLAAEPVPTPVQDRRLELEPGLFAADALILERVASRGLDYRAAGGAGLRFEFTGFPVLALWSRPGAGFLCIEPWQGFHSPEGWEGDFAAKPGVVSIPPGGEFRAGWSVTLG